MRQNDNKAWSKKLKEDVIRQTRAGRPFPPLSILKEDMDRVAKELGFKTSGTPPISVEGGFKNKNIKWE